MSLPLQVLALQQQQQRESQDEGAPRAASIFKWRFFSSWLLPITTLLSTQANTIASGFWYSGGHTAVRICSHVGHLVCLSWVLLRPHLTLFFSPECSCWRYSVCICSVGAACPDIAFRKYCVLPLCCPG